MPTQQDVLEAFDSLGARSIQPMALKKALEKRGFGPDSVATAINAAIASGALVQGPSGGIRKP